MKITLLQSDIFWEDISANLDSLGMMISKISGTSDLVILPEMFNTGFTMNATSLAEEPLHKTYNWMKNMATNCNLAICGSFIVKDGNNFYNRFHFVAPDEELTIYDKRHLFSMGGEDHTFSPGTLRCTFTFREFRIMPVICYDLRFPVWIRNRNDYDLLICVANWPDSRIDVWNTLLRARALENQCYVAGVNRVGHDEQGNDYTGESVILNPRGRTIASLPESEQGHATVEIDLAELNIFREKFPVWKDADGFSLNV